MVLDQVQRSTKCLPKVEGERRQNGIACIGPLPVVRRYWRQRSLTSAMTTSTKSIYRIKRLARNTNTGDMPVFWLDRILFPMDSSSWIGWKWMELRAASFFVFFVKLVLSQKLWYEFAWVVSILMEFACIWLIFNVTGVAMELCKLLLWNSSRCHTFGITLNFKCTSFFQLCIIKLL